MREESHYSRNWPDCEEVDNNNNSLLRIKQEILLPYINNSIEQTPSLAAEKTRIPKTRNRDMSGASKRLFGWISNKYSGNNPTLGNERYYQEVENILQNYQKKSSETCFNYSRGHLAISQEVDECLSKPYRYNPTPIFYPLRKQTRRTPKERNRHELIAHLRIASEQQYLERHNLVPKDAVAVQPIKQHSCSSGHSGELHFDHHDTFSVDYHGFKYNMLVMTRRERQAFLGSLQSKELVAYQKSLSMRVRQLEQKKEHSTELYRLYMEIYDDLGEQWDARTENSKDLEIVMSPLRRLASKIGL